MTCYPGSFRLLPFPFLVCMECLHNELSLKDYTEEACLFPLVLTYSY